MVSLNLSFSKRDVLDILDKQLDKIVLEIFSNSQLNIVDRQIVDEGTLLKSGHISSQFLNKSIIYSAPYADVIEFGRSPGKQPPVDPLIRWAKRKLGLSDKESKRVAWAVAKDIKKNGLDPRPFLGPAIDKELAKRR